MGMSPKTHDIFDPFLERCEKYNDHWRAAREIVGLVWAGTELSRPTVTNPRGEPINLAFMHLQHHIHGPLHWVNLKGGPRTLRSAEVAAALAQPERTDVPESLLQLLREDGLSPKAETTLSSENFEVIANFRWFVDKYCKVCAGREWLWVHIKEYHTDQKLFIGTIANETILSAHGFKEDDIVGITADEIIDVLDPPVDDHRRNRTLH
jgi:hypothetical protein